MRAVLCSSSGPLFRYRALKRLIVVSDSSGGRPTRHGWHACHPCHSNHPRSQASVLFHYKPNCFVWFTWFTWPPILTGRTVLKQVSSLETKIVLQTNLIRDPNYSTKVRSFCLGLSCEGTLKMIGHSMIDVFASPPQLTINYLFSTTVSLRLSIDRYCRYCTYEPNCPFLTIRSIHVFKQI